jgi:hypothetical protein
LNGRGESGTRVFTVSSVLGWAEAQRCQAGHVNSPCFFAMRKQSAILWP